MPIAMPSTIPQPAARPSLAPAKSRILETANELFYDEGIRSVGIDRLIGASTVTKATFYKHYGSKDRLVAEYVHHRHRLAAEHVWDVAERHDDLEEYMRELLRQALEQVSHPGFRGCPFLKAASEFTDPTHPVRRAVESHREWTNFFMAELLREAGHPAARRSRRRSHARRRRRDVGRLRRRPGRGDDGAAARVRARHRRGQGRRIAESATRARKAPAG